MPELPRISGAVAIKANFQRSSLDLINMSDSEFVGYLGSAAIHDGVIVAFEQASDTVMVEVSSCTGSKIFPRFADVSGVKSSEPIGMILHALAELRSTGPTRRFCFVNWDEESTAKLEVEAQHFTCGEARDA